MAIRSKYIQKLMETKQGLDEQYEQVLKESVKNIIGENAKEGVRKLLKEAEDEDSYEEEVVDDLTDNEGAEGEVTDVEATDGAESGDAEEGATDDIWNDLEDYKCEDGEYDCRGMGNDDLLKVLGAMDPDSDGIRVVPNEDGTATIEVDPTKVNGMIEFTIDLDDNTDDMEDDLEDDEDDLEVDNIVESKGNLGYTDNYQKKTAMTTPPNHEPAKKKTTRSMDKGVPMGTEKPFAHKGSGAPFEIEIVQEAAAPSKGSVKMPTSKGAFTPAEPMWEDVDEHTSFEIQIDDHDRGSFKKDDDEEEELNETMTTQEAGPYNRGVGMVHTNTNSKAAKGRNSHAGGVQIHGTGENSYSGATNESVAIKRKVNKLIRENKQIKQIVPELQQKLVESMVINASMGYIVRLLNENTTTVEEKKQISERFSKVNTLEEGKKLYETISNELKQNRVSNGVNNVINGPLTEAKKQIYETTMYKSNEMNDVLGFMNRLNKIK